MSARYRELQQIFASCLAQPNFDNEVTFHDAESVRRLFYAKTIAVSADEAAASPVKVIHEREALLQVCNAVIQGKTGDAATVVEALHDKEEARLAWKFLAAAMGDDADGTTRATVDRALTKAAVELFYVTSRPRQFDMFVHLSASEMFFIDGDSLLMAALSQPLVDWDLMQPLHVIRNAQALLHSMQSRGARFHVIFFDDQQWMWAKAPQKLFIRCNLYEALMNVAETNPSSGLIVKCFASFHCNAFAEHLAQFEPEFIVLSDGEQLGTPNALHQLFDDVNEDDTDDGPCEVQRPYRSLVEDDANLGEAVSFYYHCFLLWAASRRVMVAFSSRIVMNENAIVVFAVTTESGRFARALALEESSTKLAKELETSVALPELLPASKQLSDNAEMPLREQLVTGAVHAFLHSRACSERERQLCQAMLVTAYTMPMLDSTLRSQRTVTAPEVSVFLSAIAPYMLRVLQHRGCTRGRGTEFDLYDGHLLAITARLLRQHPIVELLDADAAADISDSWRLIEGDKATSFTEAPLADLPDVHLGAAPPTLQYQRFSHDLVEHLAKVFKVDSYCADTAYPASLGNANDLQGWVVTRPFDELNDVVDVEAEEEAQRRMTEKEKKRKLMMQAAFVTDAAQQAESMGIRGFTTNQLALICSDNDEDAETDDKGDKKGKGQLHAGQRNRKVRSKEDIIREEANVRDANRTVRDWQQQVESLLKTTDPANGQLKDRDDAIGILTSAVARLRQANFGKNFDLGEVLQDDEEMPLKVAMWRLLVEASEMREAEFAQTLYDPWDNITAKKSTTKRGGTVAAETLFGFELVEMVVAENTGKANHWGKLERMRLVNPGMTTYDATSYLNWVFLTYKELHLYMKLMCRVVRLHLEGWKVERERARLAKQIPDVHTGIPLFLTCHHKVLSVVRDTGLALSVDDLGVIRSALLHFDFPASYYDKIDRAVATWQGKPVGLLPPALRPRYRLCVDSPEMMQLVHMGHLLERPVIPQKDYRVVFNPDGWQRELLDIVDQRGCAVVCAPTSAGKTFISYYCMYNALKTSNTKVVVYVAPNRALINQAVADVCARYGSKKYALPGRNVYGIHGGADYHHYHESCQVLITLPEVLETLLLSPKYKDWVQRLDYVILDEIHTMESSGNGDVWERVLALLPCPYVALSATLGETQQLCAWLNRIQDRLADQQQQLADGKKRRRDYHVYEVPSTGAIQRWNDIKKYIYLPPPGYNPPLKKLTAKYEQRYIRDLHPLSILTLDQLRRGFPPDISLVPSEVVQLRQKMLESFEHTVMPRWSHVEVVQAMKAQLDELAPEAYFRSDLYISQRHARQYEADVKSAFTYWVYLNTECDADGLDALSQEEIQAFNADMTATCEEILRAFSVRIHEDEKALNAFAVENACAQLEADDEGKTTAAAAAAASDPRGRASTTYFPDSKEFIGANVISVLRELTSRDMGPTIVFSFESEDCDDLVKCVVEQLELAEMEYRKTEDFAHYRAMMERKAAASEAARKQRESSLKQKRLTKDDDGKMERTERDARSGDDGGEETYIVPDVLPEFTFIGSTYTVDPLVVANAIKECQKRGDDLAARAIQRGVGIHHAGVKGKLRRLMEILFRGRHCGVIFATETLALGVHSPCRSVVLAGDHVLLNTTQFRQMMGRAGRRGLDYLGHLIFLSVSMKKITRLMTSSMTVIKGNVQTGPITQLRLLQLHDFAAHREAKHRSEWEARVAHMVERLFVNPLFFQGRAAVEGGDMVRFSVAFLQMLLPFFHSEGLHFKDRPSSLGSLLVDVMHIFRNAQVGTEGFAFISMLTRGVFTNARFTGDAARLNSGIYASAEEAASQLGKCTEAIAEIMAYLFSVHPMCGVPLEVHRSVLSDPAVSALWRKANTRQHRVVLAPLRDCCAGKVFNNAPFFRMVSAFFTDHARTLTERADKSLPYMGAKAHKRHPIFGEAEDLPLMDKLRETAVPFAARDPFVAISGCGDHFTHCEELVSTLRNGLYCDRKMLPVLDLTDGCRHNGGQVLINACIADFARCQSQIDSVRSNYRFTFLEQLNGLTQSESFALLSRAEHIMSNLAGLVRKEDMMPLEVVSSLFPLPTDPSPYYAGMPRVLDFAARLHGLRSQIDKDYMGDQLRAKQLESKKLREK